MKIELITIIKELQEVIRETSLEEISDKDLVDFAVRIFNSHKIEEGKDKRVEAMKPKQEEPATKKQIWRLDQLKIDYNKNITKKEAIELIKENS